MNVRAILGSALALLLVLGIGIWLGRSGGVLGSPARPAPATADPVLIPGAPTEVAETQDDPADPASAPAFRPGERVEALSAEGWETATVLQIESSAALLDYLREDLPDERLDVRLLRRPESRATSAPAIATGGASTQGQAPAGSAGIADAGSSVPPSAGTYLGCFRDTSDFDLAGHLEAGSENTPQRCLARCQSLGFAYAGLQYGQSCLCGNRYGRYGPATTCDYACTGDPSQTCGGYSTNAIYATGLPGEQP